MTHVPSIRRLSRRSFLGAAAALTATVPGAGPAWAARPKSATRHPLFRPPTVSPTALALTAGPATVDLGDGRAARVWAYNGGLPGPTLVARTGDRASITLTNGLPADPTITHWHGMVVDHANDGHPRAAIAPGASYDYSFPIRGRAALNWYHPHPHMLTGEQVALGLAGAFVVRDAEEDALGLPSGAREVPLIVRDATVDSEGNLTYKPRSGGYLGNLPLVNGTRDPYLEVDSAVYRFRVLGGANARIFRLALSTGAPLTLIGNDGGLLESAAQIADADLSPGERLDLLIDFRGLGAGTTVMLRDLRSGWDLLEFRVSGTAGDAVVLPATLSTIPRLTAPVVTREFSFDGMTKINGRVYDMDRIDFTVPFGQVERWRFVTSGNAPHPVHVHGASFQVQRRTGGRNRVFPWESGWKDTVLLEDREQVEVLVRFDAYRGVYLMHCHKLEHEDMGMMSNFEVV